MDNIVNEVLDMFFENEKIKKYSYPVLYVVVSFNLLILLLLFIILFKLFSLPQGLVSTLRGQSTP